MSETRKLAAILCSDVVGYSRLAGADEDRILARLRALRSDLIDPTIAVHHGRVVKRTGDGSIVEFRSVVDAVRCAIEVQNAMVERNAGVPEDRRIVFRIGIHIGDVVEESDGDLMGEGVNIAARLEGIAKPGAICLSEDAYRQVSGRLDMEVTDLGQTQLKNIEKSIRAYSLQVGVPSQAKPATPAEPATPKRRPALAPIVAGIVGIIVIAGGAWWYARRVTLPANPSIAVMPFEDVGGDAATDRLANGITTDISTDLSRFRDLDVIASSATEAYGNKAADVRQIVRDFNVRYVLKGSIQREGDQVRVSAQLLDGATSASLWSKRWDRPAADVFAVQNEVADGVISTLGDDNLLARLSAAATRGKAPSDIAAYDLYALAVESFNKGTPEGFAESTRWDDAAIAKDPLFARAYVGKGWSLRWIALGGHGDFQEAMSEADRLARKAVEIDPDDAAAHLLLGTNLRQMGGDATQAGAEIDRALELNPSSAYILNISASSMSYLGKPEEGAALCDRSFRLNPLPQPWFAKNCAENYFFTKRYQDAVEMMKRHAAWQPLVPFFLGWLAAAQVELGAVDDAAATVADWKRRFPDSTVEELLSSFWRFSRQQEADQVLASLQKAGAPICVPSDKLGNFPTLKHLTLCDAQRAKEATR